MGDDPIQQPMHGESKRGFFRSTFFLLLILIIAAVLFGWSYWNYITLQDDSMPVVVSETPFVQPPPEYTPSQHQGLLDKISTHLTLPDDTDPEVSTVNDAEVLKESQPFFENVAIGDVLVVYDDYAIIYRESTDTIVNSGTVSEDDPEETVETSPVTTDAPGADVTVDIRNGTAITGYASRTKDTLVTLAYSIEGVGNAANNQYEKTVIVYKSNVHPVAVTALEELYGVDATLDLPSGERSSSADIILILGGSE